MNSYIQCRQIESSDFCLIVANYWPGVCTTVYCGLCTDPYTGNGITTHLLCKQGLRQFADRTTDWARQEEAPPPDPLLPLTPPFTPPLLSLPRAVIHWLATSHLAARTHTRAVLNVWAKRNLCAYVRLYHQWWKTASTDLWENRHTHGCYCLLLGHLDSPRSFPIEQHPKPCLFSSSLSLSSHLSCNLQS